MSQRRKTLIASKPTREDIEEIARQAARLMLTKIEEQCGELGEEPIMLATIAEEVAAEVADEYRN